VYHPDGAAVRRLTWTAGAGLLACFSGAWIENGFATLRYIDVSYFLRTMLQIGCLIRGSIEALRYWSMLRRRMRLGLADAVVANRFFLWGIAAAAGNRRRRTPGVDISRKGLAAREPLGGLWGSASTLTNSLVLAAGRRQGRRPGSSAGRLGAKRRHSLGFPRPTGLRSVFSWREPREPAPLD
jgi:hypothetical protein